MKEREGEGAWARTGEKRVKSRGGGVGRERHEGVKGVGREGSVGMRDVVNYANGEFQKMAM